MAAVKIMEGFSGEADLFREVKEGFVLYFTPERTKSTRVRVGYKRDGDLINESFSINGEPNDWFTSAAQDMLNEAIGALKEKSGGKGERFRWHIRVDNNTVTATESMELKYVSRLIIAVLYNWVQFTANTVNNNFMVDRFLYQILKNDTNTILPKKKFKI